MANYISEEDNFTIYSVYNALQTKQEPKDKGSFVVTMFFIVVCFAISLIAAWLYFYRGYQSTRMLALLLSSICALAAAVAIGWIDGK